MDASEIKLSPKGTQSWFIVSEAAWEGELNIAVCQCGANHFKLDSEDGSYPETYVCVPCGKSGRIDPTHSPPKVQGFLRRMTPSQCECSNCGENDWIEASYQRVYHKHKQHRAVLDCYYCGARGWIRYDFRVTTERTTFAGGALTKRGN
jgi:hypothetical protein